MMSIFNQPLSRRSFVQLSSLGLTGLLISVFSDCSTKAFANECTDSNVIVINDPEVEALWQEAVEKARLEGSEIVSGICSEGKNLPLARAGYTSAYAESTFGLFGDIEKAAAIASYYVSTANKITEFYDTWIECLYGLAIVNHTSYQRTVIDSGRTNAVHYTSSLHTVTGQLMVLTSYAEFYYTGGAYFRASGN